MLGFDDPPSASNAFCLSSTVSKRKQVVLKMLAATNKLVAEKKKKLKLLPDLLVGMEVLHLFLVSGSFR